MIKRPILRYFGGKWRLAKWITSHFPPHDMYVEPFGGVASVLLRKPRSYGEVYNDLNGDLVNLFRVLRDKEKAKELEHLIHLTPYARDEYELACKLNKESAELDDVDRARLLMAEGHLCSHAYSGTKKAGFSSHISAKHHNNQARE